MRLIADAAYGERSPVETFPDMFYLDVRMSPGNRLELPSEHGKRAICPLGGEVILNDDLFSPGPMAVITSGTEAIIQGASDARVKPLGGATMDGNAISGGTLSRARSSASSAPQRTGRRIGLPRCRDKRS